MFVILCIRAWGGEEFIYYGIHAKIISAMGASWLSGKHQDITPGRHKSEPEKTLRDFGNLASGHPP